MLMDIFAICGAYFLGSISFAVVISKLSGCEDPRNFGSGNPGATNMLKIGKKKLAFLTLLGDIAKSFIPLAIAMHYELSQITVAGMALASILGHLFPIFHRFKGGKGVASCLGIFLAIRPEIGLIWIGIWLMIAGIFRYSSLAGITACLSVPFSILILDWPQIHLLFITSLIISILILMRHSSNIMRILNQSESKLFDTSS